MWAISANPAYIPKDDITIQTDRAATSSSQLHDNAEVVSSNNWDPNSTAASPPQCHKASNLWVTREVLVFQTQLIRSMIKKLLLAKQLRKVLKQTMLQ
ncbi:hypothetical protein PCASD_00355 [Puccinia coronata f. sp. avenae]|uniref:Uncharacterized protein n=1 Tax=Puccinia coronata f. sp. avenae TaxID=200324 RepID=A0A2N5TGY1_9BASI|nr:hypothetical protein PCASD_05222 [Puccinia coronata f. sp. avenae]PLW51386.1 hypothetical protein PCASD_00355 [Puccinia coronata f. sp. avenae]